MRLEMIYDELVLSQKKRIAKICAIKDLEEFYQLLSLNLATFFSLLKHRPIFHMLYVKITVKVEEV